MDGLPVRAAVAVNEPAVLFAMSAGEVARPALSVLAVAWLLAAGDAGVPPLPGCMIGTVTAAPPHRVPRLRGRVEYAGLQRQPVAAVDGSRLLCLCGRGDRVGGGVVVEGVGRHGGDVAGGGGGGEAARAAVGDERR